MALIKCPDCGANVSSKAPSCIQCGCPISGSQKAPTQNTYATTQETSKKLKSHQLVSIFMVGLGVFLFVLGTSEGATADDAKFNMTGGGLMMCFGFLLFIITKVRIWWNHK